MNLRVDLILESEQRSASLLNLKSIIRLVVVLVPSLIVAAYLFSFVGYLTLKGKVKQLETAAEINQPKVVQADALSAEVAVNEGMKRELAGWRNAAIDWHRQLYELMKCVPAEVYFESLRVSYAFQTEGNVPARKYNMVIAGASKGSSSVDNVLRLKRELTVSEFFKKYMDPPEVPVFKQDAAPGAQDTDRVFRIECAYKARMMQ